MKQLLAAALLIFVQASYGQNAWKPIAEKYLETRTGQNAWLFEDESEELLNAMVGVMADEFNPAKQNRYVLHLLAVLSLRRNIGEYNRYLDAALQAHGTDSLSKALLLLEFSRYTQSKEDSPFYKDLLDSAGRILTARSENDRLLAIHLEREYANLYPYADDRKEPVARLLKAQKTVRDSLSEAHPMYRTLAEDLAEQYRAVGDGLRYFRQNKFIRQLSVTDVGTTAFLPSLWENQLPDLSVYKLSRTRYAYYLLARLFEETSTSYYSKRMAARLYEQAARYTKKSAYLRRADFAMKTGMTYLEIDEYPKAITNLENALNWFSKSGSKTGEVRQEATRKLLAKAYFDAGRIEEALQALERVTSDIKKENLLAAYYKVGDYKKSAALLQEMAWVEYANPSPFIALNLYRSGFISEQIKNDSLALFYYQKALEYYQRSAISSNDDLLVFNDYRYQIGPKGTSIEPNKSASDVRGVFDELSILSRLAHLSYQQKDYSRCRMFIERYVNKFYTAIYFRDDFLLSSSMQNEYDKVAVIESEIFPMYDLYHLSILHEKDSETEPKDRQLALQYLLDAKLHPQYRVEHTVMQIRQEGDSLSKAYLSKYEQLLEEEGENRQPELNNLRLLLAEKYPVFHSPEKRAVGWRTIQSQLQNDEAVVEVKALYDTLTDKRHYIAYVFEKQSKSPHVIRFADGRELENYYGKYLKATGEKTTTTNLFDLYWQPIAKHLDGKKTIYYVPDGIFFLINPGSLTDSQSGKSVSENHNIRVLISSSVINKDMRESNPRVTEATLISNVNKASKLASDQMQYISEIFIKNRIKTNLLESVDIPDNRATRGILYLDRPFTIDLDQKSSSETYRESRIEGELQEPVQLKADSIRQLLLDSVELVVWRGKENIRAEEFISVAKSFHHAGVRYQLIELNETKKPVSELFFDVFYKQWLRKKRPVVKAFDKAQRLVSKKLGLAAGTRSFLLVR